VLAALDQLLRHGLEDLHQMSPNDLGLGIYQNGLILGSTIQQPPINPLISIINHY
jgi:hypothetical protein